jgi:hypothetical protein
MIGESRRKSRKAVARQRQFPFRDRMERLDRWFRRAVVGLTFLAIVGLVAGSATGRYLVRRAVAQARWAVIGTVGLKPSRAEIEADWRLKREQAIKQTGATYREIFADATPERKRLLQFAGLDPGQAVLRWGNFDKILLLPGTVFVPDDTGRSYRMRPNTRAVWLRGVDIPRGLAGFFLVPDTPELRQVVEGTGAVIVPDSAQTTNSWGFRGPEPELDAPLRGLILGDSNMQGFFVRDDQTPPAYLQVELERRLKTRVSILNTGHLGYSPEQFSHTLKEFGDRFRPHFVILSLCPNDFGDVADGIFGRGDWEEGNYWLEQIYDYCRTRGILCLTTPIPYDQQITSLRGEGYYPGQINNLSRASSLHYCFPIEDLVDEFLKLRLEAQKTGAAISSNPLYNLHLDDHHFSPRGAEVWSRAVGRRLARLLEGMRQRRLLSF